MERATERERNEGRNKRGAGGNRRDAAAPSAKQDVFVMVEDKTLRTARLALMKKLETLILQLGDISEIVAEKQV